MTRLGEILVGMGACDEAKLRGALESQVLFGGRLGTNLLEISGGVTEELLARALAKQHGVRALYGEIPVEEEALGLLPQALADRLEVVPWQLRGRRLAVLCCDPHDLRKLDEVAFATGKAVEAVVVPEARLWSLLRRHYGVERELRGIEVDWTRQRSQVELAPGPAAAPPPAPPDLMDESEFHALYTERMDVRGPPTPLATPVPVPVRPSAPSPPRASAPVRDERGQGSTSASAAQPPPRPPPLPKRSPAPDPFAGMLQSSDETLAEMQAEATDEYALTREKPIPVSTSPPAQVLALGFQEAEAALAGVEDRESIARVVLRFALSRFRRAVLLTVHARGADGWEGMGEGLTPQTVARLHVPLGEPGIVQTVVESRSHVLGPLARTDANIGLLRALAGGAPKTSFAMPILARGQVVNVLYADDGRGRMVNPDGVGELLILAAKISQSYDVLLARAH